MHRESIGNDYDYWSKRAAIFDGACNYISGECTQDLLEDWLLQQFRRSDRVLEMGCGTGSFSVVVAGLVKELIATDMSPDMLERARTKLAPYANTEVRTEDCYGTSFSPGSFDAVLLANLLHVVSSPPDVLKEAKRILKPSGRVIVLSHTFQGVSLIPKLGMIIRYTKRFGIPPRSGTILNPDNTSRFAQNAGLIVEEAKLIGNKAKTVCLRARKP